MTPQALVQECDRRGITLALLPPPAPGELPRLHIKGKTKPPAKVLDCFRQYKEQIIAVLREREGNPVPVSVDIVPTPQTSISADADMTSHITRNIVSNISCNIVSNVTTNVTGGATLPLPADTDVADDTGIADDLIAEAQEVEHHYDLLASAYRDTLQSLRAAAFGNRIPPHEPVELHPGTFIPDMNRWFMLTLDRAQNTADKLTQAAERHYRAQYERCQESLEQISLELDIVAQWWDRQVQRTVPWDKRCEAGTGNLMESACA